jgi:signal peptide peptidase SppA
MKINGSISNLLSQPWAIRPDSFAAMLDAMHAADPIDDMLDLTEENTPLDVTVDEGIAVVSITGVIGNKLPLYMQRFFGMVSADRIARAVEEMEEDANIRAVVFDIDSPGGTVSGVQELADTIKGMEKPTVAHTSGLMASAAYWIGAAADHVMATPSAMVGSIGVFLPIVSLKKYYEKLGVEVDVIKAGKFKAAGYPGTDLSDDQRADLQASVDYVYRLFSGFVAGRRAVETQTMQGQDFYAAQAIENGLVDDLGNLENAIEAADLAAQTGQRNQK